MHLQGFKSLNKQARTLIQAIAAIDGSYYPEVGLSHKQTRSFPSEIFV